MIYRTFLKFFFLLSVMLAPMTSNASECTGLLKNTGIEHPEREEDKCFCGDDLKKFYVDDVDYDLPIKAICGIRASANRLQTGLEAIFVVAGERKIDGIIDVNSDDGRDYIIFKYIDKSTSQIEIMNFSDQASAFKKLKIPVKDYAVAIESFCGSAKATLIIYEASIFYEATPIITRFTSENIGAYKSCKNRL